MRISEKLSLPIEKTPFFSRPLCLLCAVFLLSVFLIFVSFSAFLLFLVSMLAVSVILLVIYRPQKLMALMLLMSVIAGGAVSAGTVYKYATIEELGGQKQVKAVVYSAYYAEQYGSCYEMKIKEIDGARYDIKVSAYFDYDPDFSEYDTVLMKGTFSEGVTNSVIGKSVALSECAVISVTNEAKHGAEYGLFLLRKGIGNRFKELLRPETAAYANAILLGDRSTIAKSFTVNMSALGISHIIAVSGMHMSIISFIVSYLLDKTNSARKTKSAVVSVATVMFMAIAGFSPSVMRAGLMLIISSCAVFCGGRRDSLTSLMLSGAIICFIAPENAISCSFLLSFSATLGIVFCANYAESSARRRMYSSRVGDMKRTYTVLRYIAFSLIVTVCTALFTAPVLSLFFSEMSFFSLFANMFAIPFATVSMLLTLICLLFGNIPFAGEMFCGLLDFLYYLFENAVEYISRNFHTSVSLRYPFFIPILILLFSVLVYMWIRQVRNPTAVLGAFILAAIIFASSVQIYSLLRKDDTVLSYYANGNSEGLLLHSGGVSAYIDIGIGSKKLPVVGITDAMEKHYETELDAFVITHYHSDHIGTVKNITRSYRISRFYLPKPENEKEESIFNEIIKHTGYSETVIYERGKNIKIGNAEIVTVPLCYLERSAHPVLALQIKTDSSSVAYLGASFTECAELYRAERFVAESSAVICGTHGPVIKEQLPYLYFEEGKTVYLSPYEQTDESRVFPKGIYVFSEADVDGISRILLDLSL